MINEKRMPGGRNLSDATENNETDEQEEDYWEKRGKGPGAVLGEARKEEYDEESEKQIRGVKENWGAEERVVRT